MGPEQRCPSHPPIGWLPLCPDEPCEAPNLSARLPAPKHLPCAPPKHGASCKPSLGWGLFPCAELWVQARPPPVLQHLSAALPRAGGTKPAAGGLTEGRTHPVPPILCRYMGCATQKHLCLWTLCEGQSSLLGDDSAASSRRGSRLTSHIDWIIFLG